MQVLQSKQPKVSALLWTLSAAYIYILLLSPPGQILPGEPIWAIQPQTLQELWNESINFFFILPVLNAVGIQSLLAPSVHPWIEAQFNFAEAWILMFLPLLLADQRSQGCPKVLIWGLAMFLTNTFLCPYMAVRAAKPQEVPQEKPSKGLIARVFGVIGIIIGGIALIWGTIARPEFGDLTARYQYFIDDLIHDRVTIAFCVDLLLFTVFQAVLIGEIEPPESGKRWLRFIPFWGLAVWLLI
ncbi:hypothetical protein [Sphaerospermopsis torques-reginae]|uniref:Uncharacterized protein n=1 Tax=Sphaerospermopsis torques-reginae ITEP-024 TaxID=984208 RepID=A0ABX8X0I9_9CYAN|nr:hypothetical protein [Sphaerospermopsis torques-reginae]QYX31951.1 hypothetical protein K2F26_00425 [Sphaerospermopsis torques-reginae ITEP-024]